ncbi:MAG: M56 family metallopeptidase [Chitinophagaceae bacterium]
MQTLLQSAFLQSLGWAIVQSTWQITILWLVYKGISKLFLPKHHGARITLAMLTLLAGFSAFIVTAVLHYNNPQNIGLTGNVFAGKLALWTAKALPYLSFIYLLLLVGGTVKFVRSFGYVRALQLEKHAKMPFEWRLFTRENATILGISKQVHIWLSELADSPVTVGFFKPMILIPVSMVNQLSAEQMEAVILHELAHIKRNDYLLNILLAVMEGMLFFHPFVHLLGKEIRKDREFLCDDLVLQFRYKPTLYAAALLQAEKNRLVLQQNRFQLAAIGEKDALMERIQRITGIPARKKNISFRPVVAVAIMLLFGVFSLKVPLSGNENNAAPGERNFGDYPMAVASLFQERTPSLILSDAVTEEITEISETTHSTETEEVDADIFSPEIVAWEQDDVKDQFIPVADKEYSIIVDGEQYTGKVTANATVGVTADTKPFTITLTRDSTALLLYNLVQGEYMKALDLGKLSSFLDKLDWEKIAHEQAKGMESIHLMQEEIAKAMKDVQWEQLKASAAQVALELEAAKLSAKTVDSLRIIAKKKAKPVIRL